MEKLKVKNIIISNQNIDEENHKRFKEIVNKKKIRIICVDNKNIEKQYKINIENDLYFEIIWPDNLKHEYDNSINNNSIVCKLHYKKFLMLFTGDIEKEAEEEIVKKNVSLKANILKVAHHGSNTSTSNEFLERVKPNIVLIGVKENNKFGHPNEEIIDKIDKMRMQNI